MKTALKAKWRFYCAIVCLMGGSSLFFYWINHNSLSSSSSSSSLSSPAGQPAASRDSPIDAQAHAKEPMTNAPSALSRVSSAIQKNPAAVKAHAKLASGFGGIQNS
ncbi:MAG: hypothetical protein L6437_13340 [Kiritimatiellae bacterium]|nr:hypothetical protein [Verrucomicrobiota bacterium]MBU4366864.1 hypothetical protein [Verrucomicrobiota bacterium]MCG2661216.1 hypothetical protein [Kiritimatiellia bacterium]